MSRSPSSPGEPTAALELIKRLQPALQRHERSTIVDIVRRLVALRAPMGDQWQGLADIALQNGELTLAREAIDLFVEARHGDALAQFRKIGVLEQCGATAEAHALLRRLPDAAPDPVTNAYSRGVAAIFDGDLGEARSQLECAVQLRPQLGAAWIALATAFDLSRDTELADRIVGAEREMASAAPQDRAAYAYALGKVHADLGNHERAFSAFLRGAREMQALVPYNLEADRRNAADSVREYSREGIAALAARQSEETGRTIFVTGLPRSGTSLVEQALTAHSAVGDGGEINRLLLLVREMGGHLWTAVSRYAETRGPAEAARLFGHWIDERFPGPGRVVDKSLTTTRVLGLAAALLPESPLVWLKRDPLDCAWSCFRTFFQGSHPWSHDLADIAAHFRIEDRLLEQWQDLLGERLLVVPYEALATSPEPWLRRILAHCGLEEEPQVFAPHENVRVVQTASLMQVRRPINRGSIGSAEPYREFLAPFIESYGA
jgi:tetratricopeptide (TPR) repeat protein